MESGPLVALTGGTGFVGSHLAEELLGAGFRVRALARRPDNPGWLKGLAVEIVKGDVRDAPSLEALVAGASTVVHAAGKTSARSEAEYMAANAAGTANVVRATLGRAPEAHFVLVSSVAAAGPSRDGMPVKATAPGRPVSAYGRSKLEGENEVRSRARLSYTILRPCAVYGPRETAIRDLFVAASKGVPHSLLQGLEPFPTVFELVDVDEIEPAVREVGARRGRAGEEADPRDRPVRGDRNDPGEPVAAGRDGSARRPEEGGPAGIPSAASSRAARSGGSPR